VYRPILTCRRITGVYSSQGTRDNDKQTRTSQTFSHNLRTPIEPFSKFFLASFRVRAVDGFGMETSDAL